MRKILTLAAVAAMGLSASALAANDWDPELDKAFDLGTFDLEGSADGPVTEFVFDYTVQGGEVGFSFSGNYDETGAGSWASDTRLEVLLNGQVVYNLGGFSGIENDWDFQGSQSTAPGFYAHGVGGEAWDGDGQPDFALKGLANPGDVWSFRFTNGWNSDSAGTLTWSDAQLVIHKIPAPGALALLGVAGIIGSRRRRA